MWNSVWAWVLSTKTTEACICFSSFGECIVAGIEVFALLQLVLQEIFAVGKFAVESEELLLLFRERLVLSQRYAIGAVMRTHTDVNLVLLMWVHICVVFMRQWVPRLAWWWIYCLGSTDAAAADNAAELLRRYRFKMRYATLSLPSPG